MPPKSLDGGHGQISYARSRCNPRASLLVHLLPRRLQGVALVPV